MELFLLVILLKEKGIIITITMTTQWPSWIHSVSSHTLGHCRPERNHSNALQVMNEPKTLLESSAVPFTALPKTFEVLSRFACLFQRQRCSLRTIAWRDRTLTDSLRSLNYWGWRLCRHRLLLQKENDGGFWLKLMLLLTVQTRYSTAFIFHLFQSPVGGKKKKTKTHWLKTQPLF